MVAFLQQNLATLLVGLVVAAVAAAAILYLRSNRKRGRGSCGCGCETCPHSEGCKH